MELHDQTITIHSTTVLVIISQLLRSSRTWDWPTPAPTYRPSTLSARAGSEVTKAAAPITNPSSAFRIVACRSGSILFGSPRKPPILRSHFAPAARAAVTKRKSRDRRFTGPVPLAAIEPRARTRFMLSAVAPLQGKASGTARSRFERGGYRRSRRQRARCRVPGAGAPGRAEPDGARSAPAVVNHAQIDCEIAVGDGRAGSDPDPERPARRDEGDDQRSDQPDPEKHVRLRNRMPRCKHSLTTASQTCEYKPNYLQFRRTILIYITGAPASARGEPVRRRRPSGALRQPARGRNSHLRNSRICRNT